MNIHVKMIEAGEWFLVKDRKNTYNFDIDFYDWIPTDKLEKSYAKGHVLSKSLYATSDVSMVDTKDLIKEIFKEGLREHEKCKYCILGTYYAIEKENAESIPLAEFDVQHTIHGFLIISDELIEGTTKERW